jgi:hypothetical protein
MTSSEPSQEQTGWSMVARSDSMLLGSYERPQADVSARFFVDYPY